MEAILNIVFLVLSLASGISFVILLLTSSEYDYYIKATLVTREKDSSNTLWQESITYSTNKR